VYRQNDIALSMLRSTVLALVLLLQPPSFAFAQDNTTAIASIRSALREHRYDEGLALTRSSLNRIPADFRIWTLQGMAFSMKGDNPAALKGEAQLLFQTGDKRVTPVLKRSLRSIPAIRQRKRCWRSCKQKQTTETPSNTSSSA
jgi:hypothetical protein